MSSDQLIPVYTATNPHQAEIVREALVNEGIPCEVEGEHQAGLTGVLDIRLFVRKEDADRALAFIESHEHHEE
ncbi:MAG: hypothetical protein Tsb009_21570 [Planctomycetaceae bacterium]